MNAATPASDDQAYSEAVRVARHSIKGALASLDQETGAPFVSLVATAFTQRGAPLLLLSELARHTGNISANSSASLLFDGTDNSGAPLEGARVTYSGFLHKSEADSTRRRFLARHADARGYSAFADFGFFEMQVEDLHFIEGFGKIFTTPAADALVEAGVADAFADAEASIVENMNADHADAVGLYATQLAEMRPGDWRLTGCDADGFDLACAQTRARLDFPVRLETPTATRKAMVALLETARAAEVVNS